MFEMFPMMSDRPEGKTVVGGGLYWLLFVIGLPFGMSFIWWTGNALPILLLYAVSFLAVGVVFFRYLRNSFFNVRCYPGRFWATVGISGGTVLTLETALLFICLASYDSNAILASHNILPMAEVPLLLGVSPAFMEMPLLMLLCSTVFVPLTMCCLYYGVGFAPAAEERPWLGYLIVAVLAAVPRLFGLGNTGYPLYQLIVYFLQLPWHLCACWAYQKADTIWAPICMYVLVNLVSGVSTVLYIFLTRGVF